MPTITKSIWFSVGRWYAIINGFTIEEFWRYKLPLMPVYIMIIFRMLKPLSAGNSMENTAISFKNP